METSRTRRLRRRGLLRCVLPLAAFTLIAQPGTAAAETTAENAGMGAASAFCSLLYAPTKLTYATLGAVFGGMAWGLSGGDGDVLNAVLLPAVRGDYVVTPAHLRGDQHLEFVGRRPGYGRETAVVAEEVDESW